jgi:hypothetical protein
MKNYLLTGAFICTLLITACKKDDQTTGELYGKWVLTEQYADPGDGSGTYQKVKELKTVTFLTTGETTGEVFEPLTRFKILDSVRLEITTKDVNRPLIYYYKVTAKQLVLNPPCIEGCGLKFKRVK